MIGFKRFYNTGVQRYYIYNARAEWAARGMLSWCLNIAGGENKHPFETRRVTYRRPLKSSGTALAALSLVHIRSGLLITFARRQHRYCACVLDSTQTTLVTVTGKEWIKKKTRKHHLETPHVYTNRYVMQTVCWFLLCCIVVFLSSEKCLLIVSRFG